MTSATFFFLEKHPQKTHKTPEMTNAARNKAPITIPAIALGASFLTNAEDFLDVLFGESFGEGFGEGFGFFSSGG